MSENTPIEVEAPAGTHGSSLAMIRALSVIAMLSGVLVVLVFQFTQPMIAENRRLAIQRAVFEVVPGAIERRDFTVTDAGLEPGEQAEGIKVYAGYDAQGELKGIATEAAARGYQDVIRILYGYNPACECVTGISILQSTETPGLGTKIGTDPEFLANFDALDASLNDARTALRNAIVTVKHGTKTKPWQIDAISGATISAKAVGKMINESAQSLLPRLDPHTSKLKVMEP